METIYTKQAPDAIGPYSQAIVAGELIFTSGQIPIDPATGTVEAQSIEAQTEQVMKNLQAVLKAAGKGTVPNAGPPPLASPGVEVLLINVH